MLSNAVLNPAVLPLRPAQEHPDLQIPQRRTEDSRRKGISS